MSTTTRYILAWLPMVLIAILNGAAREFLYADVMSDYHAHQLSTFTLITLFALYTWILGCSWPIESQSLAIRIGLIWLALTVLFEFTMGYYIIGLGWPELLEAYDITTGNLWLLVPLSVTFLPVIVFRARE